MGNTYMLPTVRNEEVPVSYVWITSAILLATDAEDIVPYEYTIELELA